MTFSTILAILGIVGPVLAALGTLIWKVATLSAQLTAKVDQLTEAKVDVARLHALEVSRGASESVIANLGDRVRALESNFPRQLRGSRPDLER